MDGERSDGSNAFFSIIFLLTLSINELCFVSPLFLRFMILVHIMILDTLFFVCIITRLNAILLSSDMSSHAYPKA